MNYSLLVAGMLSAMAVIGHFTVGRKEYLMRSLGLIPRPLGRSMLLKIPRCLRRGSSFPVLSADIEEIPKKVMHSLFHYMSVFMVVSAIMLLFFAFGNNLFFSNARDVSFFIGILYAGFALSQFLIAITSSIKSGIIKMFQWIFWTMIAVFVFLGIN